MKILTWLFIFLLFPLPLCQAKYIASDDGRVVFETDDDWYLTSLGGGYGFRRGAKCSL